MDALTWVSRFFGALKRDQRGSTVTLIAAAAVPLVAFVGLSVDTARGYLLKQRMGFALDGAVLAAATLPNASEDEVKAMGKKFFDANFPSGYMGIGTVTPTFTLSTDKTTVTGDVTADMPTALMSVVGLDTVDIGSNAAAQRQSKGLELVLALDNTGSMSNADIRDLKDASEALLDVLYGDRETVDNLWVGLVPFDLRVNLANYPSIMGFTATNPNHVCANQRSGHETDDATPSTSPFDTEYNTEYSLEEEWGCQAAPALALTKERSTLDATLEEMDDLGGTRIDIAAAWAFRMISPKWKGLWGDPDTPKPYDEPLMEKAVIIMTDGENAPHPIRSPSHWKYDPNVPSAATANARLTATCTAMKDKEIIVYTIQFNKTSTSLRNLLTNCATSPDHYYHAASDELDDVFVEIANKLSNLRLLN